jgi:arylsulfatase A-like enzyme
MPKGKPDKLVIWGDDIGWSAEDPTIAELLKPLGYTAGQFGTNHFGNLYHLNAEEEQKLTLPRGVLSAGPRRGVNRTRRHEADGNHRPCSQSTAEIPSEG